MFILQSAACALMAYFLGCINPAYIIAQVRGFDIRQNGSGNAGASNAAITMGKRVGIFSALFDILKPCISIWAAERLFHQLPFGGFAIAAVFCSLGHIFPVFMAFRGGKGLACITGIYLMYSWRLFVVTLACMVALALLSNYICSISLTAPAVFTVYYTATTLDFWGGALFLVLTAVMLGRHVENLRRIKNGTEMRLSYLWNAEKEKERIQQNRGQEKKS